MGAEPVEPGARLIRAHIAQLLEHFDAVQVFCTRQDGPLTDAYFDGRGNWFARYGQVRAWLIAEEKDMDTSNRTEAGLDGDR